MCSWWFVNTEETFALLLSKVPPNPSIMLRECNCNKSTVQTSVQLSVRDGTRLEALRKLLIYYHMRGKSRKKKKQVSRFCQLTLQLGLRADFCKPDIRKFISCSILRYQQSTSHHDLCLVTTTGASLQLYFDLKLLNTTIPQH